MNNDTVIVLTSNYLLLDWRFKLEDTFMFIYFVIMRNLLCSLTDTHIVVFFRQAIHRKEMIIIARSVKPLYSWDDSIITIMQSLRFIWRCWVN